MTAGLCITTAAKSGSWRQVHRLTRQMISQTDAQTEGFTGKCIHVGFEDGSISQPIWCKCGLILWCVCLCMCVLFNIYQSCCILTARHAACSEGPCAHQQWCCIRLICTCLDNLRYQIEGLLVLVYSNQLASGAHGLAQRPSVSL